jgi:RHS repeat-associated protein
VTYGYDNLYRLTSETIANAAMNGTVGYQYDAVGNRKQITSTLAAIPSAGLLNYDANDRTTTDQYDANGNTVSQGGIADTYDFENHLIQHGYITYVYDGDGNRVAKGFGGVTTNYLVDTLNPTGYAQVLDELQNNTVARSYIWGLQLVSESQLVAATPPASPWQTSWYGFDGHGSVRYLTNSTGVVTDTYDYDAFGNLINSTGRTANNYLFAGEQFDPDLGLYYNRARYLDVRAGRFWGMDTEEGDPQSPLSLHKYLYGSASPVNNVDPSGNDDFDMASIGVGESMSETLDNLAQIQPSQRLDWVVVHGYTGAMGFGHVGVGVDSTTTEGLYPAHEDTAREKAEIAAGRDVPAAVHLDGATLTDSVTIHVTSWQARRVREYVSVAEPPNSGIYNLYGRNCARFVEGALRYASLEAPDETIPIVLMSDLHSLYRDQN